ncbi:hypothetical protein HDU98_011790 [Podochytrium sp. JEL0797]|nr:hypothetical protein HDU98_011790 [Podochytrium sp. JEL0797]
MLNHSVINETLSPTGTSLRYSALLAELPPLKGLGKPAAQGTMGNDATRLEMETLKREWEDQRGKYERRIIKLKNKIKVVKAESSVCIYGLQEQLKAFNQPPKTACKGDASAEEFLRGQVEMKNQVIKDLSIQVLELNQILASQSNSK